MRDLILLALLSVVGWASAQKRVVCYYTNWSNYRNGKGKFLPSDVDPYLCTHVLYSFVVLDEAGRIKIHDPYLDLAENYGKGGYSQVVSLKNVNPNLKVMIAIGGWNERSERFSAMSSSAAGRKRFVDSVVDFIQKYGFDGLDLDWEYPTHRGGQPADKENFVLLIKDLQAEFRRQARANGIAKWELSAAVNPADGYGNGAYDRGAVCSGLDFVNLMEYDMHGSWEKFTGLHAPLYPSALEAESEGLNIDYTVKRWLDSGCDRSKLVIGMPTYGRSWTLDSTANAIGAPASQAGRAGTYTGLGGMLAYYEICEKLSSWTEHYVEDADTVYATGGNQWVSYDNEESISRKVMYVNELGLGGAMIWSLDFDDFSGTSCGRGKYPLLSKINQVLGTSQPPRRRITSPRPRVTTRPSSRTTTRRPIQTTTTTRSPPRTTRSQAILGGAGNRAGTCTEVQTCPSSSKSQVYVDPCNPQKYIWCLADGRMYRMACPGDLVIDINLFVCTYAKDTPPPRYDVANGLYQDQGVPMQLPPVTGDSKTKDQSGGRRSSQRRSNQRRRRPNCIWC